MEIKVFYPQNTAIKSLIEFYFYVESLEAAEVKTIPNGRVDASIILDGTIEWFFNKSNKFEPLPPATFYPPTRTGGRARSLGRMHCIGIKFYPHILALPMFENTKLMEPLPFDEFFKTSFIDEHLIRDLKKTDNPEHRTEFLDAYFLKHFFSHTSSTHWIQEVTQALESGSATGLKIGKVAENMGISIKTLERRFQKVIGLTPKMFSSIIQLHQATHSIRKNNPVISHGDLTTAVGNGYYDQSHFIKSCRRITGFTPKELFTHLPDQITDLVIVE